MKQYVFRLHRGDDLYESLHAYCKQQHIQAGYAAACVGCLLKASLRSADGATVCNLEERMEIVSLTGTVSENRCHLHISLSREDLSVIGGHLMPGCIVNTTAEVVLCELTEFAFAKEFDPDTGYNELKIIPLLSEESF